MKIVNNAKANITRFDRPEDLANAALDLFVEHANQAINQSGSFTIAISGGNTPTRFFELLGDSQKGQSLNWERIQLFWVDERCVPPEADASNYALAANTFLKKVCISPDNIHRMYGEAHDYMHAIRLYEEAISKVFKLAPGQIPQFDLIMLGMGADGHIGSLFPNSYAVFDTADLVSTVYMTGSDYSRMTLTLPVLCAASHIVILISGQEKANIVNKVFCSEPDEVKYPIHTLWPILDRVTWLLDSEAAKCL